MNNEIKSQDDLNRQGRESDVLIATIMKCQELVKGKVELENENKRLKELLKACKEHLCHHYCHITVKKLEKKIEEVI